MYETIEIVEDENEVMIPSIANDRNLLLENSRKINSYAYNHFLAWRRKKNTVSFSENTLLAYFNELSRSLKPSTLWTRYSMIRSILTATENMNMNSYRILYDFLKNKLKGYTVRKAKVFKSEDLQKFFIKAPDKEFLSTKVATIFAIHGACGANELTKISMENIQQHDGLFLVKVFQTKTEIVKSFTIQSEFTKYINKYKNLRHPKANPNRFFLSMRHGKCTIQPIGINTFASMPKRIAEYLKLPDANLYTTHSFRRTSATILATLLSDAATDINELNRNDGCSSLTTNDVVDQINGNINLPSTSRQMEQISHQKIKSKKNNSNGDVVLEDLTHNHTGIPNNILNKKMQEKSSLQNISKRYSSIIERRNNSSDSNKNKILINNINGNNNEKIKNQEILLQSIHNNLLQSSLLLLSGNINYDEDFKFLCLNEIAILYKALINFLGIKKNEMVSSSEEFNHKLLEDILDDSVAKIFFSESPSL